MTQIPNAQLDKLKAAAMMAIGGLIAGLCGACTASFWITFGVDVVRRPFEPPAFLLGIVVPLLFGGLPTLLGLGLFRAGLRRYRRATAATRDRAAESFD